MHTMGPSLMNQPTAPFNGPGAALYGPRGPQGAHNTGRVQHGEPPASIGEHIDQALSHVAGLSPRLRNAVKAAMVEKLRDIHLVRLIAEQAHGPWSERAAHPEDEGRPL